MTPEDIYANRFATEAVSLIHDFYSPNIPITPEDQANDTQYWQLIGRAIYRANTGGAGTP